MVVEQRDLPADWTSGSELQPDEISPLTLHPKITPRAMAGSVLWFGLWSGFFIFTTHPDWQDVLYFFAGAGGVALFFSVLARLSPRHGRNMTLSAQGFENHHAKKPPGKHVLPWSKLRLIGLQKSAWQSKGASPVIVLNFADEPDYAIPLTRMSQAEQQHFFRIISRYVPQTLVAPEILYLQVQCLMGSTPCIDGFTEMWSQEFDKRFELANHVTLPAGHRCGNDRYTIELTMATRMSSSTYLASDRKGGLVVIKELVVPVSADEQLQAKLLEQFDREAGILASISHPSIVSVHDHFVEGGRSYLVMECAPGDNLRNFVRLAGACSQAKVVSIALQLLDVLKYLHSQEPPIIHRDLTPDNIVYQDNTDQVKVVDFGAANIYQSHGTGTLIGKQGYMPPEQFKGKSSPASDIYALGSTMLFLLSGQDPPGMGRLPDETLGIDSDLKKLLAACLEFDQVNRPSLNELTERLELMAENLKAAP